MPQHDPITQLRTAIAAAASAIGGGSVDNAKLERPPRPDFGDFSTNAAMLLAGGMGESPRAIAEKLGAALSDELGDALDHVDVAGPGFLNLFMADGWYRDALTHMYAAAGDWGGGRAEPRERVLVEFVSANPTGPITAASGRHAAFGDALARIIEFAGHQVQREYYVNDAGTQIQRFGESIRARARGEEPPEEGGYHGEYVKDLARKIPGSADGDPEQLARAGVDLMLKEINATLQRFRVVMDRFFSERSLHDSGAIEKAHESIDDGLLYESEDAVWMRTTQLGDDKDRVLRRKTGEITYFGADIAYHETKIKREFDRAINLLGADHHGYKARIIAAWQALGGDAAAFEVIIMQLVNLLEGGRQKQMSKRAGTIVTLDELVDDIGVDAARFFLLQRSHDTTLDLDLTLAREQTQDNPVYYVQYAHARIASILRRAEAQPDATAPSGELHPSAKALVKALLEYPSEIDSVVELRAPHRLTTYARELAQQFSAFYRDCKVVGVPEEGWRLALSVQTQQVLARSLDLLGVGAPEEM